MAVAMFLRSPELELDDYDRLVAGLELDAFPPIGQLLHVAVEQDGAVDWFEIWQTGAAATAYVANRLEPALAAIGAGELTVELFPLHNLFSADLEAVGLIGGVSLPAHVAGAAL